MGLHTKFSGGINRLIQQAGTQLRVEYFTPTIGSVWDDDVTWVKSGNSLWTSGIVFPVRAREGSSEAVLLQQGKLIDSDKTLWTTGSLSLAGSSLTTTIMVGSGTNNDVYTTIPEGGQQWEVEGNSVYQKQWIRRLTTGSLIK